MKVPKSAYRSKTEADYAAHLDLMVHAGEVSDWSYEPVTLKLAEGVRYSPDFEVRLPDGRTEWHEVKGRKKNSFWSRPMGKVKVRLAARLRPWWDFFIVWPEKRLGTWAKVEVPK